MHRRSTHFVPFVAIQRSSSRRVGGGLVGSAPGRGPTGRPARRAGRGSGGDAAGARARWGAAGPRSTCERSYTGLSSAASKCRVPNRAASSVHDRVDRADAPGQRPGQRAGQAEHRPGSGSRMVSTSAPAARQRADRVRQRAADARPASKPRRSVSLIPDHHDRHVGAQLAARAAAGRAPRRRLSAPLTARLCSCPPRQAARPAGRPAAPLPSGDRVAHAQRDRVAQRREAVIVTAASAVATPGRPRRARPGSRRPRPASRTARRGPGPPPAARRPGRAAREHPAPRSPRRSPRPRRRRSPRAARRSRVHHHRRAAGQRLQRGQAERLHRPGRQHDVGGGQQRGDRRAVGDEADEASPAARRPPPGAPAERRSGPSPATTSTAGTPPPAAAPARRSTGRGRFSGDSRPQWTISTSPRRPRSAAAARAAPRRA